VHDPYFFTGREQELRDLIDHPTNHHLGLAACAGTDPDVYHPDKRQPDEMSLFRCTGCPARLACLALALRAEDADAREGWYGGLQPADRDDIGPLLRLEPSQSAPPDRAIAAEPSSDTSGWPPRSTLRYLVPRSFANHAATERGATLRLAVASGVPGLAVADPGPRRGRGEGAKRECAFHLFGAG
jgi:hypothetical protein